MRAPERPAAVRLAREIIGSGPPLLFLHGLFGSRRNLRTLAQRLAASHRCCLVDLRNHGDSPHARPADYAAMAADVFALMDEERWPQAALVGHSMGGKVAMSMALWQPSRVHKLVVLDTAPIAYPPNRRKLAEELRALDLTHIKRRSEADLALAATVTDASLRTFLLQNLVFDDNGRARWRLALDILIEDMDHLAQFPLPRPDACYPGPALFLRGGRSDYVPATAFAEIRRLFPQAIIETIADAGHLLHAEQPAIICSRLKAFLAE